MLKMGNPLATGRTSQQIQQQYNPQTIAARGPMNAPAVGGLGQLQQRSQQKPQAYTPEQLSGVEGYRSNLMSQLKSLVPSMEYTVPYSSPQDAGHKYIDHLGRISPVMAKYTNPTGRAKELPMGFFDDVGEYSNFNKDLSTYYNQSQLYADAVNEALFGGLGVQKNVPANFVPDKNKFYSYGDYGVTKQLPIGISLYAPTNPLAPGAIDMRGFNEANMQRIIDSVQKPTADLNSIIKKYITPEDMNKYLSASITGKADTFNKGFTTAYEQKAQQLKDIPRTKGGAFGFFNKSPPSALELALNDYIAKQPGPPFGMGGSGN